MIVIVNLVCPKGHPVLGSEPHEYASDKPPEPWLDTISRDFMRFVKNLPATSPQRICNACGAQFGPFTETRWTVSVHQMHAKTRGEAMLALAKCAQAVDFED